MKFTYKIINEGKTNQHYQVDLFHGMEHASFVFNTLNEVFVFQSGFQTALRVSNSMIQSIATHISKENE